MFSVLVLSLIVFSLIVLIWFKKRKERFGLLSKNNIPGPSPDFIFGNLYDLKEKNVERLSKWHAQYGDIYGYYVGSSPTVVVHDPELLKLIQIKDFHLFNARRRLLKGGFDAHVRSDSMLISQHGQRWKEVRSILTPTFNSSKMKATVPLINDAVDAILENIEAKSKNGEAEFDIYELFQGLTMDTIGRAAFGVKTDVQRNPEDEFLIAAKTIFADQINKPGNLLMAINIWFPEWTFFIYPLRWLQARVLELFNYSHTGLLYTVCDQIISMRRKNIESTSDTSSLTSMKDSPWSRDDLLQKMLEAKLSGEQFEQQQSQLTATIEESNSSFSSVTTATKASSSAGSKKVHHMTHDEVVANAVLFFEAGYETTSTCLAFVAHILVNHLDVQDRVRQEVLDLVERQGELDYNCVTELQFMEAVIYETMRIFPPITLFVTRMSEGDYHFKDIVIPEGAGIIVPVYQLHHSEKLWESPETFDPMRFYGKQKGLINPIAWQPFGQGPRNCIGMRFAMLEAKLALARILMKYKLEPGPKTELGDIEVDYKPISMCPKNGVWVRATPLE